MTRLYKTTFFLFSLLVLLSCSKDDDKQEVDYSYIIEFGTECGWCAGTKYISVKKGEIEYSRNIPCGDDKGINNDHKNFDYDKWDELIDGFDLDFFATLDYDICNVCADGCDEIIEVTRNGKTHQIRYNPNREIEGIEPLQAKLKEIFQDYFGNS